MVDLNHARAADIAALLLADPPATTAVADGDAEPTSLSCALGDLLSRARESKPIVDCIETGIPLLDDAAFLVRGEYAALIGAPGVGKSLLADSVVVSALRRNPELRAIVVALETSILTRVARLLCGASITQSATGDINGVPLTPLVRGSLREAGLHRLEAVASRMLQDIGDRLTFTDSTYNANEIALLIRKHAPDIVVVDHAGLMRADGATATEQLDTAIHIFYEALRETGAAGLLLAELSKDSLKSGEIDCGSVRGTARLASLAACLIGIGRDDDTIVTDGQGVSLTVQIAKARHGIARVQQAAQLWGGLGYIELHGPIERIVKTKRKRTDEESQ